jgi:hypothetical protein
LRKLIFITIIFKSFFVLSQTEKDSILTELRNKTVESGITIRKKSDSTQFIVYRLCERWADKVSYLKSNLTDTEIKELKAEKNASMNVVGLITELEKNNTKEYAIEIIDDLIKIDGKYMSYGCSDAISTMPISNYFMYLLTNSNFFFKPDFKLKKKEIRHIENEILMAENKFWRK